MSDMKLIMESWRDYSEKQIILKEAQIQSLGDLLSTIQAMIAVKKGEKLTGNLLKIASAAVGGVDAIKSLLSAGNADAILGALGDMMGLGQAAIDLVTGSQDARQVVAKAAKLPDSERTKAGYLAMLDFDDNYLEILDDKLENDLLNYLLDKVSGAQAAGTDINNFDVNKTFEEFIKDTFNRAMTGAPQKRATDIVKRGKASTVLQRGKQKVGLAEE